MYVHGLKLEVKKLMDIQTKSTISLKQNKRFLWQKKSRIVFCTIVGCNKQEMNKTFLECALPGSSFILHSLHKSQQSLTVVFMWTCHQQSTRHSYHSSKNGGARNTIIHRWPLVVGSRSLKKNRYHVARIIFKIQ